MIPKAPFDQSVGVCQNLRHFNDECVYIWLPTRLMVRSMTRLCHVVTDLGSLGSLITHRVSSWAPHFMLHSCHFQRIEQCTCNQALSTMQCINLLCESYYYTFFAPETMLTNIGFIFLNRRPTFKKNLGNISAAFWLLSLLDSFASECQ